MDDELISVLDIARQYGRRKATVFKVLKRLGIIPVKRRNTSSKNQMVACITQEEFHRVGVEMQVILDRRNLEDGKVEGSDNFLAPEVGIFYLIQLEPKFDPGRFKLGFAVSVTERLRHLRCSAPFATLVRTWPCRPLWERTAIESVATGCERLHSEVFRTESLDAIVALCERFFAVMPPVQTDSPNQAPNRTGGT